MFIKYKTVLDNYLKENTIKPVKNKFFLSYRAEICDNRLTVRIHIEFDANAHEKGEVSKWLFTGLVVGFFKILGRNFRKLFENFRKILGAIGELYQNLMYKKRCLKLDRYFVILK